MNNTIFLAFLVLAELYLHSILNQILVHTLAITIKFGPTNIAVQLILQTCRIVGQSVLLMRTVKFLFSMMSVRNALFFAPVDQEGTQLETSLSS